MFQLSLEKQKEKHEQEAVSRVCPRTKIGSWLCKSVELNTDLQDWICHFSPGMSYSMCYIEKETRHLPLVAPQWKFNA